MIRCSVQGQELIVGSPVIAADSINYLTAEFIFRTNDWDGLIKIAHFSNGEKSADIELVDDWIPAAAGLNLSEGCWTVSLTGHLYYGDTLVQRITTTQAKLFVKPSAVPEGEPIESLPSYGEQILGKVEEINEKLGSFTAEAEMLPAGSEATASYDGQRFLFGIPTGPKGDTGDPGTDGFSPVATAEKAGSTAVITITDKNGTTIVPAYDDTDLRNDVSDIDMQMSSKADQAVLAEETTARQNADNDLNSSKIPFPTNPAPKYGTNGQFLRTNGLGGTEWVNPETPTSEQIQNAVYDWMEDHPDDRALIGDGSISESKFDSSLKQKTLKDYATPHMYGYVSDSYSDVGYYINRALSEHDTVFVPDGKYRINTTISLFGNTYEIYGGKYHHTKGKTVIFSPHAILDVRSNITVFDISGNANTVIGGMIDLTTVGSDYSSKVIYLHSETLNTPCFGNKIEGLYISNANNTRKGTGIELHAENDGYIYSNTIDGVKLQMLEYGVKFSGVTTKGMNSNMFTNISYWSCVQCAVILGGGNVFTGVGQCGKRRDENDESACFYIDGGCNTIDMFVYDVGSNATLTQYIYELAESSYSNVLRYIGIQKYKGNNKVNSFIGYEADSENISLLVDSPTSMENDYKWGGNNKFNINRIVGCFDANNFLNTEYVSDIECELISDISVRTNLGIDINNKSQLRSLSKTTANNYGIIAQPQEAGVYILQIKYTFNLTGMYLACGMLDHVAFKTKRTWTAAAKNISTVTVKQILSDDTEINMEDMTPLSTSAQIATTRAFKVPSGQMNSNKQVKNLIIRIAVNATGKDNPSTLSIYKIFATMSGWKKGDAFNGIANRSGDNIFGDYVFSQGTGVVLKSPNNTLYRLKVDNNGNLTTEIVT